MTNFKKSAVDDSVYSVLSALGETLHWICVNLIFVILANTDLLKKTTITTQISI